MRHLFRKVKNGASSLIGHQHNGDDHRKRMDPTADLLGQLHKAVLRRLSEPSEHKVYVLRSSSNDPNPSSNVFEEEDPVALLQPISKTLQNNHSTAECSATKVICEGGVPHNLELESPTARLRQASKQLYDHLSTAEPYLDEDLVGLLAEELFEEKQYRHLVPSLAVDLLRLLLSSVDKESNIAKVHVELLTRALGQYVKDADATFDIALVQTALELCLCISVRETASGAAALTDMRNICLALYQLFEEGDWLNRAIGVTRLAVALQDRLCVNDTAQMRQIESLCNTHRCLACMLLLCSTDRNRALDEAVTHCKHALDLAPTDDGAQELRMKIFEILYAALKERKHSGFPARFEYISASLGVLQSTPDLYPTLGKNLLCVLVELSTFYSFRYVELPEFDPATGKRLKEKPDEKNCFENDIFQRVQHQIDQEVEAVKQARCAQEVQANFAEASDHYFTAYEEKSSFVALASAIELGNIAILLSRPGTKPRNEALLSQAEKIMQHVHCTSNPGYVNLAIHYAETSLADMSDDSPIDYVNALRRYGRLLFGVYEQTYAAGLLDDAIETIRRHTNLMLPDKAYAAISAPDNISWLHAMQTLAKCYEARYLRNHDAEDSETANWIAGTACDVAQQEHLLAAERPSEVGVSLLWTYGKIMLTRYRRVRRTSLLKGCIMNLETCMKLTSIQHMEWPDRSETLSDAYRELMKLEKLAFNRAQAMLRLEMPYFELNAEGNEYADVSAALGMHTLVLESLQSPARFMSGDLLRNGPILLEHRRMKFACYARITNKFAGFLEESAHAEREFIKIAAQEESGKSSHEPPPGTTAESFTQEMIDRAYGKQFGPCNWQKRSPTAKLETTELWLRNALRYYRQVAESPECIALERINAAFRASKLLAADDEREACALVDRAVKNLATVDFIALTLKDQEYLLQQLSGLPSWAATLALRTAKPATEVMEMLETTRARITGVALDLRRDLSRLREADPHTAAEYERITKSLLSRGTTATARLVAFERNGTFMAQRLSPAAGDLKEAAQLAGITRQLRDTVNKHSTASPRATISEAATDRPLVSFVTTELGSYAITVARAGIGSIPLPKLFKSDVDNYLTLLTGPNALYKGLASTEYSRNSGLSVLLEWLWDCAVGPVLEFLGLIRSEAVDPEATATPTPRIWWVNGGALSAFPLHAAGKYGTGSTQNAMSQVVSSYTSSLRMLEHLRALANKSGTATEQEAVIVSMSTTHGMAPLPFAAQEATAVQACLQRGAHVTASVMERPSKQDLVARVAGAGILHLICHGQADAVNPSDSYLVLDNTAHDGAQRLRVEEIGSVQTSGAHLAYLSACSSAEHGNNTLVDEAVHLANSFQMIGVPRVIATLWPVDDEASATIAAVFYETLALEKAAWNTAEALHKAVKAYMQMDDGISSNAESFLSWVPLVHYGI